MDENYTLFSFKNLYQNRNAKSERIDAEGSLEEGMFLNEELINFSPSDFIIKKILDFSKSYDVVKTVPVGYIELNLN